jgi:hypothetical protein
MTHETSSEPARSNASGPLSVHVDLTVFGLSPVIETRLPRSVYGRLAVGDEVFVYDDDVEPRPFRVDGLHNQGRDVRLTGA